MTRSALDGIRALKNKLVDVRPLQQYRDNVVPM